MPHPKISVIVPVYNAGAFFKKRLDTLIHQTLKEIEIILILDCPTDGSDRIAEEYAGRDERIVIVRNPHNLHIGLSRNEGLKKASGEYISFSDHDDYSELDMFEKMYAKAKETDADIVVSDFYGKSEKECSFFGFPADDPHFLQHSFSYLISGPRYKKNRRAITSNGLIWNQIYRRQFLSDHHLIFPDNRKITFEDRVFLIGAYYHARKITVVPEAFYYHIYHKGSAGSNYTFRSVSLVVNYLLFVHRFLENHGISERESLPYSDGVLLTLYSAFRNELRHKSVKQAFAELSKIRNNSILQQALRNFFSFRNFKQLRKYRITKLCFLLLNLRFSKRKADRNHRTKTL